MKRFVGWTLVGFLVAAGWAQGAEPPDLERVSVLATNSAAIGSHTKVLSGDVIVQGAASDATLDPGYALGLARHAVIRADSTLYADRIRIRAQARVRGDVVVNELENEGQVFGEVVEGLPLPVLPALPRFEQAAPGDEDVVVARQQTVTLTPGAYGDLRLEQLATVRLEPGDYDFASIAMKRQTKVRALGPVRLRIAGTLSVGPLSVFGARPNQPVQADEVLVYVGGDAPSLGTGQSAWTPPSDVVVRLARQAILRANVLAPTGTIRFDDLTTGVGAFVARDVSIERSVTIRQKYGFPPAADTEAPTIEIVEPALATYLDPTIAQPVPAIRVTFGDAGDGLDLSTLEVVLDNLDDPDTTPLADLAVEECQISDTEALCPSIGLVEATYQVRAEIADLAGNVGFDEHTYSVDFTGDDATPTVTLTGPVDGAYVAAEDVTVTGTVADDTDDVLVLVNSDPAEITGSPLVGATYSHDAMLMFEGPNPISVLASDAVGHTTELVEVTVIKDTIPPVLTIASPAQLTFAQSPDVVLAGVVVDVNPVALSVDGTPLAYDADTGAFETVLDLPEGTSFLEVVARDPAGNEARQTLEVAFFDAPTVTITSPAPLGRIDADTALITGTVDEPVVSVVVAGVLAQLDGTAFQASVPLREGTNLISAIATDAAGSSGVASVEVFRDSEPPVLAVVHPAPGSVVHDPTVTVVGSVRDISVAVGDTPPTVVVNGAPVTVANRGYAAEVALVPGANVIDVTAADAAGNTVSRQRTVTFEPLTGRARVLATAGDGQSAPIASALPAPLVVTLLDSAGQPVEGENVLFRVTAGDGSLTGPAGDGRGLAVATDAAGQASVSWTLGLRAGLGVNRVEATAVGFAGRASFDARAEAGPAAFLLVDNGNYQLGAVSEALPKPFTIVATDEGHNPLVGVPVTFTVLEGGGELGGGQVVRDVSTDDDGKASVFLTLGPMEGSDNNVVQAEIAGVGDGLRFFYASSLTPGDPALTSMSGVVLDNTDQPIEGATVHIAGTAVSSTSNAQGQFQLGPVPVGRVLLEVDGNTSTRPGAWPTLEFERVTVAGRDNRLERPVYLLPLDMENGVEVSATEGATLTLPDIPGFALEIAPGSATFGDGGQSGTVAVTVVHNDKVPMLPSFGQQPLLAVTIQPSDVVFDPPARLTMPNTCGLAPGAVTELFSFRHDQEQFVPVGTAQVTADGERVVSTFGNGIVRGGWHLEPDVPRRPPRDPPGDGCQCAQCFRCARGNCVLADPPPGCDDGKFCTVNDRCTLTGGCSGEKRTLPNPISVTIPLGEIKEGIEGPVRFFQYGGQCEILEGSYSGSMSGEKASKCCENLNAIKSATKISGSVSVKGAGFKCFLPGASVNTGFFQAGVRAGLTWGIGVSASGGNDPCQSGCDREFSASLSGAITGELVLQTVGDVLELSAGISGGAAVTAKFGCGMSDFSGMLGPITVFGKAVLFGFVDVEIKEEVPNTKISR